MNKIIKLLVLLLAIPVVSQAQEEQRMVAIDTLAARQLATFWYRQPKDSLACLYGNIDKNKVIVIDSAPTLSVICSKWGNPKIIGIVGFIPADRYVEEDVVMKLSKVLEIRTELLFVGVVHNVMPINFKGRWIKAPGIWGAFRSPK